MPNQRAIAQAAGVNQATVSLALRNSPAIPLETRERIRRVAEELGYQPNSYVSSLMSHIRAGKAPSDQGSIALLTASWRVQVDGAMLGSKTYVLQHKGMVERARKLGFSTEYFSLESDGMTIDRVDSILQARGIRGLVLTAPNLLQPDVSRLSLGRYAMATVAYSWPEPRINRVTTHHRHNIQLAYQKLREQGRTRIGMCLPEEAAEGVDANWKAGFLLHQDHLPARQRIPMFIGKPSRTPLAAFKAWLEKWKPDSFLSLVGHEKVWLDELEIPVPDKISIACLNRLPGSCLQGVEENHEVIGAAVIDLIVAQILRNEYGPPAHPMLILIEGKWVSA